MSIRARYNDNCIIQRVYGNHSNTALHLINHLNITDVNTFFSLTFNHFNPKCIVAHSADKRHITAESRCCNGLVRTFAFDELQTIDVGKYFNAEFAGAKIPSLQKILQSMPEDLLLNIEIKNSPVPHAGIE